MNKVVCDVETAGLCSTINGLCSVTMKFHNDHLIKTWFIKPNLNLKYEDKAFEVNGLSLKKLVEIGQTEKEVVDEIIVFLKDYKFDKPSILGHNITFDIGFLKELFKRNDKNYNDFFHYRFDDTMLIARFLNDAGVMNIPNASLGKCYEYLFKRPLDNAHTSEADVLATEKIYNEFIVRTNILTQRSKFL